jgi:hypothetical protein
MAWEYAVIREERIIGDGSGHFDGMTNRLGGEKDGQTVVLTPCFFSCSRDAPKYECRIYKDVVWLLLRGECRADYASR